MFGMRASQNHGLVCLITTQKSFGPKGNSRTKELGLEAIIELMQDGSGGITQPRHIGPEVNNRTQVFWGWMPSQNQGLSGLKTIIESRFAGPEDSDRLEAYQPKDNHRTKATTQKNILPVKATTEVRSIGFEGNNRTKAYRA